MFLILTEEQPECVRPIFKENTQIINIYNKKKYTVLSSDRYTVKVQDKEGNFCIMASSDVRKVDYE